MAFLDSNRSSDLAEQVAAVVEAEAIREALLYAHAWRTDDDDRRYENALRFLDSLLAYIKQLEGAHKNFSKDADEWREKAGVNWTPFEDAEARLKTEIRVADHLRQERDSYRHQATELDTRLEAVSRALEKIAEQQPKTLAMIERNGFVFDSIGREPGNWQHLAFAIYTDLCEVDTWARSALEESHA